MTKCVTYRGRSPQIHPTAFIAPNAVIIGDVRIGPHASIWYNCVLRADLGRIVVGANSNIQDGTIIHTEGPSDRQKREGHEVEVLDVIIGENALIGHQAMLHGCTVEDRGFVGMSAVIMDKARVCSEGMLGAGAMLTPGKILPSGELWAGRPAKLMRSLGEAERAGMTEGVEHYLELAIHHREALAQN